jgi:hypothetical protein
MLEDATLVTVVSGTALLCGFALFALVVETIRMQRPKPTLHRQ